MFKNYSKYFIFAIVLVFVFSSIIAAKQYEGQAPDNFNQAPEFEKMVEDGELPPVEERLPEKDDLYVVEPNDQIGEYGGTLNAATLQMEAFGDDNFFSIFTNPLKPSADGSELIPHVVKNIESSEDMSIYTMNLRKGLKWSDGELFTADDILFWYNDVLLNEDLTPAIAVTWKTGDKVMDVEKIDDYTVEFKFDKPNPFFKNRLVHAGGWDLFFPKHYLKQFHPEYVSEGELAEVVEEEDFDNWWELFQDKARSIYGQPITEDRPTLAPYILVRKTSSRRVYERNPYYWKVDTEGNQLPYVKRIETELASDIEVVNGKIISGEIDFAVQQSSVIDYPMYRNYEDEAGYRTVLWESGRGGQTIYMVNMTHEEPEMREIFQDVNFRRALSLAMDRDEINQSLYFGQATPRQYTVLDSSQYFEDEFANSYIEFDPEKAGELLDEVGLVDQDGDGWRERPDGENFSFTIEFFGNQPWRAPSAELVSQHWQEVGIDVQIREVSGELIGQRAPANMLDATLWNGDKATDVLFPTTPQFLVPYSPGWERTIWPAWATWFQTDGNSGEEPPEDIKQINRWWRDMMEEPDEEKRIELGKKILSSQAENLWSIGTVGKVPYPVIINENLRNFPEEGLGVWDTLWTMSRDPEQFYFEGGSN